MGVPLSSIEKQLTNRIPDLGLSPEKRVMFAALMQAIEDVGTRPDTSGAIDFTVDEKIDSCEFFLDGRSKVFCNFLGLDEDLVVLAIEEAYLEDTIGNILLEWKRYRDKQIFLPLGDSLAKLTELAAQGKSNVEIAEQIGWPGHAGAERARYWRRKIMLTNE